MSKDNPGNHNTAGLIFIPEWLHLINKEPKYNWYNAVSIDSRKVDFIKLIASFYKTINLVNEVKSVILYFCLAAGLVSYQTVK